MIMTKKKTKWKNVNSNCSKAIIILSSWLFNHALISPTANQSTFQMNYFTPKNTNK